MQETGGLELAVEERPDFEDVSRRPNGRLLLRPGRRANEARPGRQRYFWLPVMLPLLVEEEGFVSDRRGIVAQALRELLELFSNRSSQDDAIRERACCCSHAIGTQPIDRVFHRDSGVLAEPRENLPRIHRRCQRLELARQDRKSVV